MRRRLMLDGPTDAGVFKILVQAFLSGGNAQQEKGKDFIYSLSRIKRALFACGEVLELPLQAGPDDVKGLALLNDPAVLVLRARQGIRLNEGGQTLELTQQDFDRLEKAITQTAWTPLVSDDVAAAFDRISTAEILGD